LEEEDKQRKAEEELREQEAQRQREEERIRVKLERDGEGQDVVMDEQQVISSSPLISWHPHSHVVRHSSIISH